MYLIIDRVIREAFGIEIRLPNNIEVLENLLRFLSKEINLEKVELEGFNTKLKL